MINEFMLERKSDCHFEQSLRQTRNAQNRLLVRLREVEAEAERLRQEIEALENSAAQTEAGDLQSAGDDAFGSTSLEY